MHNITFKGQEIFNPTKGKEKELIELFVEYYGEKHRKRIEERINNNVFFYVNNLEIDQSINYYVNFFEQECRKLTMEAVSSVSGNSHFDKYFSIKSLINLKNIIKNQNIGNFDYDIIKILVRHFNYKNTKNLSKYAKLTDVLEWISDEGNKKQLLKSLDQIFKVWNESYKDKYDSLCKERTQAVKFFLNNLKENKVSNKVLDENALLILEGYIRTKNPKLSNRNISKDAKTLYSIIKKGKSEFVRFSYAPSVFDERCIGLFNHLGYDLGNSINLYKCNKNLIKTLFNQKLLAKIKDETQKVTAQFLDSDVFYKDAVNKVKELEIGHGNYSLIYSLFNFIFQPSPTMAYTTFYLDKDKNLKSMIVCQDSIKSSNETFIHELNHAVAANIIKEPKDGMFVIKSGVYTLNNYCGEENFKVEDCLVDSDYMCFENPTNPILQDLINFDGSMIDEVVNDYISLEIAQLAKQKNIMVCHAQDQPSGYAIAFPIFKKFIDTHKQKIKECLMSNNIRAFENFLGKESSRNFSQIATIVIDEMTQNGKYHKILLEISNKLRVPLNKVQDYIFNNMDYVSTCNINWSKDVQEFCNYYKVVNQVSENILNSNKFKEKQNKCKEKQENEFVEKELDK